MGTVMEVGWGQGWRWDRDSKGDEMGMGTGHSRLRGLLVCGYQVPWVGCQV